MIPPAPHPSRAKRVFLLTGRTGAGGTSRRPAGQSAAMSAVWPPKSTLFARQGRIPCEAFFCNTERLNKNTYTTVSPVMSVSVNISYSKYIVGLSLFGLQSLEHFMLLWERRVTTGVGNVTTATLARRVRLLAASGQDGKKLVQSRRVAECAPSSLHSRKEKKQRHGMGWTALQGSERGSSVTGAWIRWNEKEVGQRLKKGIEKQTRGGRVMSRRQGC